MITRGRKDKFWNKLVQDVSGFNIKIRDDIISDELSKIQGELK